MTRIHMKPTLCQFPILWLLLAFIGRPGCVHAQTFAGMPFTETFESGSLQNYWSVSGTGPFRGRVASANAPHGGFYHYTMDCSLSSGALFARNELTLGIN